MVRRLFVVSLLVLTALFVFAGNSYDSKEVMCVDTVELELDATYTDNLHRSFEIEYWNGGKGKLAVDSVLTSCHCTTVKYDKVALSHGKRSCFKVDVDMSEFGIGRYYGDIFIYYNGRKEPFELHFTGMLVNRGDTL